MAGMAVLLADLDDTTEQGIFVGGICTVAFDDGVYLLVCGEIHCRKIGGWREGG